MFRRQLEQSNCNSYIYMATCMRPTLLSVALLSFLLSTNHTSQDFDGFRLEEFIDSSRSLVLKYHISIPL